MPYDNRRSRKLPEVFTPEEEDVAAALREYTADPDKTDARDFMPSKLLYQIYREYVAHTSNDPGSPGMLGPAQFGAALIRVFPDLDDWREPGQRLCNAKVRRRINKKRVWGYQGMKGPLSIRTQTEPGRPPLEQPDAHDD